MSVWFRASLFGRLFLVLALLAIFMLILGGVTHVVWATAAGFVLGFVAVITYGLDLCK